MTNPKRRKLRETYAAFKEIAFSTLQTIRTSKPRTYTKLHHAVYRDKIQYPTVRFDKRLFSWKRTRRGHPVLSVRCNSERLGLPIQRDGAYRRLLEHMGDDWAATSVLMTRRYRFLVLLKKNPPAPRVTENVVGVDQNSNGVAVTVMNKQSGRILRQLYLGRDISLRQIRYENRRAALQEHRDKDGHRGKAGLKLRRLSGRQRNYVRTNTWLLVKHLTDLAIQHGASIAIERLYKLRRRKGELGRKSRRKMNRIPYGFFRHALTHKSAQIGIPVVQVPAKYTSQTCPRCGYVSRRNRRNWRYFRCVGCRYEANADRVANVNICRKAIQATYPVTRDQILPTGASVRRLDMQDEEDSWQPETPQSCKLPTLVAEKLTSAYLQLPVHKIVKRFKGRSSHMLRREFPELLKLPSLWTHSNFVSTAGHVSAKTIQEYIQRQSKR